MVAIKTAILITYDRDDSISEAVGLCDSAGYEIVYTIKQHFLNRSKYGISTGALDKLEKAAEDLRPDVIIYDEILKPSQNYNLASVLHKEILDRETLILEIFESRASSTESKLQVKLAQLRYEMARAKERVHLSSMGEQPGFMGIGKFGVDVYYNDIKHRMNVTRGKLEKSGRQRELHRQGRRRAGFKTISLAGYTSAGKTTLFNKMTGGDGKMGRELFTTLSTTVRRITTGGNASLISDTVGFISKLPAYMIDAFSSTLEELRYADAIILVIDFSDPIPVMRKKISSCQMTLGELGVGREKMIYALNKSDLLDVSQAGHGAEIDRRVGLLELKERWIAISAETGANIDRLKDTVADVIAERWQDTKDSRTSQWHEQYRYEPRAQRPEKGAPTWH